MIRFAPKNRELDLALRAVDSIAPEQPFWLVPAGDGVHVDVRAMSEVQLISIRLASIDRVEDAALSVALPHHAVHLLGPLAATADGDMPLLFEADSALWRATNSLGTTSGALVGAVPPEWDHWMVPPVGDMTLIDPELLGGKVLATMLCDELPAEVGTTGEGTMLVVRTERVRLWTIALVPLRGAAQLKMAGAAQLN